MNYPKITLILDGRVIGRLELAINADGSPHPSAPPWISESGAIPELPPGKLMVNFAPGDCGPLDCAREATRLLQGLGEILGTCLTAALARPGPRPLAPRRDFE